MASGHILKGNEGQRDVQSINWGEEKEEGTQPCLEVLKELEYLLIGRRKGGRSGRLLT